MERAPIDTMQTLEATRRRASLPRQRGLRVLPRHEDVVCPPARTAGPPDELEAGANDQDQCGGTYVMLVKSLLRRQAAEAGPVGGRLVDGIGDALRQRAHCPKVTCNVAATDGYWSVVAAESLRSVGQLVAPATSLPVGQVSGDRFT